MLSTSGNISSVIAVALPILTVVGTPRWRDRPVAQHQDQVGAGDLGALGDDSDAGAGGDDRLAPVERRTQPGRESRRG